METPDYRRGRRLIRLFALFVVSHAGVASAEVTFQPSVAVGVARTDNVFLAPTDPQSETVYQLQPRFSLQQEAPRLTTEVGFAIEAYRYDELGESDVRQNGSGSFVAALDPDNFFFEVGGARGQAIRDPDVPIPYSNLPISSNRVDRDNYFAGLSFDYPFGANTSATGGVLRDRVHYDQEATATIVSEFYTDTVRFALDNHRKESGLSWAVSYEAESTDFGVSEPWQYRQAGIELGAWLSAQARVFAIGGQESAWDDPFDASFQDSYWELGFAALGDTLSAEVAFGERVFGSSKRVSLEAVQERWQTSISYAEQPTSVSRDLYSEQIITGGFESGSLSDLLTRPGTPERYISKLFRWTLGLEASRTAVYVAVFDETREQRKQTGVGELPDESQSGLELSATWRIGVQTELFVGVRREEVQFESGARDLRGWSAGVDRSLGRRTSLTLSFSHEEDTPSAPAPGPGYKADLVEVLLLRNFHR